MFGSTWVKLVTRSGVELHIRKKLIGGAENKYKKYNVGMEIYLKFSYNYNEQL